MRPNQNVRPIFVTVDHAAELLTISRSTVERLSRTSETSGFPKPRLISDNRVGYRLTEIEAWADARPISDLPPPPNTARQPRG